MKNLHRLPNHVIPERYRLVLRPDLDNFLFSGEETIYLRLKKPESKIVLHAKELQILHADFKISGRSFLPKNIQYLEKAESVVLDFGKKLPKGSWELNIKFSGVLNDKMRGFYRSRYTHIGKERHLATTQFEATDARRAFPCFDEPAAKAIFDVTLIVPEKMTALSNTIESRVLEHSAGYKLVEFEPTPRMSTYLLAFIVGDLEFIEARSKRGVLVRVFTTPGKKNQAKFAIDCAIRSLDFYEKYFDINYPLPVLDMIAIPDFSSAAMENWGAIVYRETALLVDGNNSSAATRQWAAIVVAHEIAHMWFGNLVTMDWWTHLWLNEGFASYMEYKCVDNLFPKWRMWEQYVSGRLSSALKLDALQNTHPVEVEVFHPGEISEIFDEVSYAKGSAIIRMLAEFLGEKTFRDGLRHYLKKHSYKNTKTEDLWKSLEKISGKPVKKIMDTWTKQPGYPYMKVTHWPKRLRLEQDRFFSSRISNNLAKTRQVWKIPLSIGGKKMLLETNTLSLKASIRPEKFNLGETSLLRVAYPPQVLKKFGRVVLKKKIPAIDRLGLIRDVFALAESGQISTAQALDFAGFYNNEDSLVVWEELADGLARLRNLLFGQDFYNAYLSSCRQLYSNVWIKLGWNPKPTDSHNQRMLRSLILNQLSACNDKTVQLKAKQKLLSGRLISADIRSAVYNSAARTGGIKEHVLLISKYTSAPQHEEQERIGRALAQFSQPKLLLKTLYFALSKHVRFQDSPFIIAAVLQNSAGRDLAWKFIGDHWQELVKRYGDGLGLLGRLLKSAGVFTTKAKAREIEAFFKKHPVSGANRTVQQVLEKILSNADWLERESMHLNNWFKKYDAK